MCCDVLPDCGFFEAVLKAEADFPVVFQVVVDGTKPAVELLVGMLVAFVGFTVVVDGERLDVAIL